MALTESELLVASSIGLLAFAENLEELGVESITVAELKRAATSELNRAIRIKNEALD
ncbi:hypothetical protein SEA_NICEHOUSE_244 [Rhodococcus phage NiceHouse]|nr:hypothetical protein SEA_NICEHOUSE_244 [Rhodococcus phage NiceHouse]